MGEDLNRYDSRSEAERSEGGRIHLYGRPYMQRVNEDGSVEPPFEEIADDVRRRYRAADGIIQTHIEHVRVENRWNDSREEYCELHWCPFRVGPSDEARDSSRRGDNSAR